MTYTVSEIAEKLGLSASALRFYDRNGLLPNVERSPGGVRKFTEEDIESVKEVVLLRECGFSIKEIAELVKLPESSGRRREILRSREEKTREEIERLNKTLMTLEKWLS
ncbi:MAG: MerR family transcriptional regulator [Oscillospiraceae bacterium]|nr:MerR family transcriptional regulator [Oscillospiraceae bacterium]